MSKSAIRVRSSALFFADLQVKFRNAQKYRHKARATLMQPAEEVPLVEWRRDGTGRIAFEGKELCLEAGNGRVRDAQKANVG
jgi:hypothetical protein